MDGTPELSGCPRCRASVRAGAPWCTQCHLVIRASVPAGEPARSGAAAPARPGAGAPAGDLPAGWPCQACAADNPFELDACRACGAGFLGGLRSLDAPRLVLPVVGDLSRMARGRRLALACAVVLVALLLVALLALLLA